jgi:hypothetical protein
MRCVKPTLRPLIKWPPDYRIPTSPGSMPGFFLTEIIPPKTLAIYLASVLLFYFEVY